MNNESQENEILCIWLEEKFSLQRVKCSKPMPTWARVSMMPSAETPFSVLKSQRTKCLVSSLHALPTIICIPNFLYFRFLKIFLFV